MYSTYRIENGPRFGFNGSKLTVESDGVETTIDREELENLVEWLKINLEKLNRDKWDAEHVRACNCVNVAND